MEPLDGAATRWEPDFIYGPAVARDTRDTQRLSAREREILQLVAEGHTCKAIAAKLGIGARTVETHRRRLMRRVGARTAAQLVRLALAAPGRAEQ